MGPWTRIGRPRASNGGVGIGAGDPHAAEPDCPTHLKHVCGDGCRSNGCKHRFCPDPARPTAGVTK